jgi:CheY-like chemotaxis protein
MTEEMIEILLVEDSPYDAELTLRALRQHNLGNRVHVARDGQEALDFMFATGDYDRRAGASLPKVVLLDLKLPKVDGIEVLRRLKDDERTRTTPVVVLTSSREEQDLVQTYRLGVNSYIVKPVDFEQFVSAVADLGFYWVLLNARPVVEAAG